MALTEFQRAVCRVVAANAKTNIPHDIDVFHDTTEAVAVSWTADRAALEGSGYRVDVQQIRAGFVEANVASAGESVVMQWTADSAFRFFPLVEHDDFGLTLHPFDLATNKTLALVGRLEVRDWVDLIHCHGAIQRLGYLAWAAAGKDPGFGPSSILEQAGRSARYSHDEVATLAFAGPLPDAADLSRRWREMFDEARALVAVLPPHEAGHCVLGDDGALFNGDRAQLIEALESGRMRFHQGRIRGALPQLHGA